MWNIRAVPAAVALVIGTGLAACGAPSGGPTVTPTFYEIFPGGTKHPATSAPATETLPAVPVAGPPSPTASQPPRSDAASIDPSRLSATVRDILGFYPLAKGATWTYQASIDMSTGPGPDVTHWSGMITQTVSEAMVENGFPVYRLDWSGYPDFLPGEFAMRYFVVREAGIYQAGSADKASALARSQVFTQAALMGWPLAIGKQWGDPDMLAHHDGRYVSVVEASETLTVPVGTLGGCYRVAFYTNPDTTLWWFCPGKGLARFEYQHNGTTDNQVWELESFKPGS